MIDNIDDIIESCAEKAGMTISRYLYVYRPTQPANECCMTCKHTCSGCSWGEKLEPVEGWIAEPTKVNMGWSHRYDDDSFKIYYCPKYEECKETTIIDDEAAERLFKAITTASANGYRKALETIQISRIKLKNKKLSLKQMEKETRKYAYALEEKTLDESYLPKWACERMRKEAKYEEDKELDAEMQKIVPAKTMFW